MSEPDPSGDAADADLMERMATGNREAFASLFRRYHGLVYRFSVQMSGSRDVAEDVTQEVFIALAENHAALQAGARFAQGLPVRHRTSPRRSARKTLMVEA